MFGSTFPFSLEVTLPWTLTDRDPSFFYTTIVDDHIVLDMLDELLSVACIAGLMIVGFSRQPVEDERIGQLRMEALQWGVYANYLVLIICTLAIYGSDFFTVTIYNMFTLLLIFIARFYWLLFAKPLIEAKRERSLSV